jgi:hypothetical protein
MNGLDLKSAGAKALWGFDSPSRHQENLTVDADFGELRHDEIVASIFSPSKVGRMFGGGLRREVLTRESYNFVEWQLLG